MRYDVPEEGGIMNELLNEKLELLPMNPGCYLMKDQQGTVIYVGKAKVLKNRVKSYFTGSHDGKTLRLVSEITDFETIITSSDLEALILELHLIKQYDPKYNIMLKGDNSYPYLKLTFERHPKLIMTRHVKKDKGKYFGPYPNVYAAMETKKLLDRIYPYRKCHTIPNRVCLYYHLGQCLAPCVNEVDEEVYQEMITDINRFLNGGYQEVKKEIYSKMLVAAEALEFERAQEYRDQIRNIETVMEKQAIAMNDFTDRDVFGYAVKEDKMCVQVFFVRQGKVIEREVSIFSLYNSPEEELVTFIGQFYSNTNHLKPKEILLPENIDRAIIEELLQVKSFIPQRGKKKDLVKLATKNAEMSLHEKVLLLERQEEKTIGAIKQLGNILNIAAPKRIEAFDNSHIHGTDAVSAMIAFVDGMPKKSDYRKYKTKTAAKHDDYGAMREVIRRRYSRVLKEQLPLADLIVIDGGKGQMEVAREVLEDELGLDIPIVGLAKDEKHNTSQLLFGEPPEEIKLEKRSEAFYLLQRIQDEVHRFAITFHRQQRSASSFESSLDKIPGIGTKRKKMLLQTFGSIKKIQEASKEQLEEAGLPKKVAQNLKLFFETTAKKKKT